MQPKTGKSPFLVAVKICRANFYMSKSPITSSTLRVALLGGTRPPSGSSIFRLTLALFRIPTILAKVLIALAVEPMRPIRRPISSGSTLTESRTPSSSTVLTTLTSSGLLTISLMIISTKSLSRSCDFVTSLITAYLSIYTANAIIND